MSANAFHITHKGMDCKKTWLKITLTIGNTVLGIIIKLHAKIVKLIPF